MRYVPLSHVLALLYYELRARRHARKRAKRLAPLYARHAIPHRTDTMRDNRRPMRGN